MSLSEKVFEIGSSKDSRLLVALDVRRNSWDVNRLEKFIEEASNYIVGFKIGIPMILSYGLETISNVIDDRDNLIFIADMKLADIGYVGKLIIEEIASSGFDAIIMHGFIGFKKGVEETVLHASKLGVSPILVAAMSHDGGEEYLNKVSGDIIMKSLSLPVEGYVLPATFKDYIKFYRGLVGDRIIMSPGVGAQGAKPGEAIKSGADLEIVGRLIYMDEDPISRVRELHGVLKWHLQG